MELYKNYMGCPQKFIQLQQCKGVQLGATLPKALLTTSVTRYKFINIDLHLFVTKSTTINFMQFLRKITRCFRRYKESFKFYLHWNENSNPIIWPIFHCHNSCPLLSSVRTYWSHLVLSPKIEAVTEILEKT